MGCAIHTHQRKGSQLLNYVFLPTQLNTKMHDPNLLHVDF